MISALRGLPAAFGFLTRLPVGGFPYSPDELRWSSAYFPLVGAVLGAALAAVMMLSARAGTVVAATLAVSAGMLLTGAFHEDGLADTADALGGATDRDKLFVILRDSRIGSFGAAALCMALLLRVALLSALSGAAPLALVLTQSLARLPPVWMMALLPSVSPEGARSSAIAGAGGSQVAVASGWVALLFGSAFAANLIEARLLAGLLVVAALTAAACAVRFLRRAGGLTGDFLGATEQVLECALLLTLALWRGGDAP
jgi:adenosylcobinamide-GDP ribazoletransferase